MKRFAAVVVAVLAGFLIGSHVGVTHAQATGAAVQFQAPGGAHTLCTVVPSTTAFCFATDGFWQSINGAAFAQVGASGPVVTSVSVCNAAGASCGTPLTGPVVLSIPTKVTVTSTAPTASL